MTQGHAFGRDPRVDRDLRVGDAERETAMEALREHYAQGRLTHAELGERLDLALTARTGQDLARVREDLPDLYAARAARAHHAAGRRAGRNRHPMARRGGPPAAPLLFLLLVAGVAVGGFGALKFVFVAWLALTLFRVLHRRGHARGSAH
jgi:hypothetical protein